MAGQLEFDERTARRLERNYLIGDAQRRRDIVRAALSAQPGERVLDAGCGPGFYCAELADEVGPDGAVVGVDLSPAMLELARRRCEGRPNVSFADGPVTALPAEDAGFDALVSVQVLEYVPDIGAALREMHRVLRPGGRIVAFATDWAATSIHSGDDALTDRVLRAWDEHLAHPALPRVLAPRLRDAGFEDVSVTAHGFVSTAFAPDDYAGVTVPFIGRFVTGRQGIAAEDAERWVTDLQARAERGDAYVATLSCCFSARRPG